MDVYNRKIRSFYNFDNRYFMSYIYHIISCIY